MGYAVMAAIAFFLMTSCTQKQKGEADKESTEQADTNSIADSTSAVDDASAEPVANVEADNNDALIKSFITDMYNNEKYNDYAFLQQHCTQKLLDKLSADYEDEYGEASEGVGYSSWLFRTDAQDIKPGSDEKSEIISVTPDGDGWYTYEFKDMGYRGKNRVKASVQDGVVMIDDVQSVWSELQ